MTVDLKPCQAWLSSPDAGAEPRSAAADLMPAARARPLIPGPGSGTSELTFIAQLRAGVGLSFPSSD
jgi:hypothetical protein